MTSVEIGRRLPLGQRHAIVDRIGFFTEEMWTVEAVSAAIRDVVLDGLAEPIARTLLAEHPEPPLAIVDGHVVRPRTGPLLAILNGFRTAVLLEPEPPREVPGRALPDVTAVARMLDLTIPELEWFADHGQWLRHAARPLRHYRVRRIPKRAGGVRVIEAPKPRLAEAQRRILRHVLDPAGAHPAARGFRPGGSVLAYASPHIGARTVVRLDLRDCFSTVTAPRVRGALRRLGHPAAVAGVLADLCTVATPGDESAVSTRGRPRPCVADTCRRALPPRPRWSTSYCTGWTPASPDSRGPRAPATPATATTWPSPARWIPR